MDFLQNLESGPRLVKVRGFTFRRGETGTDTVVLQHDLTVLGKA